MIGFGHPLSFNLKGVNSGPYDDFTVATSSSSSSSSSSPLPLSFSRRSSCRESLSERDPVSEASSEASESEGEDDEDDSLSRSFSSGMKITLKREEKHVGLGSRILYLVPRLKRPIRCRSRTFRQVVEFE